MSSSNTRKNNNKELIFINKPTEIDNEIFRYFEYYQNLNPQTKTNTITSNFFKKKAMRKANNNNSNQTPQLMTSLTPSNPILGSLAEEKQSLPESELNRRVAFTNFQRGLDDNYFNDMENKRKAKLGLLLMMNKYSGGEYCKEIKNYFAKLKKSQEDINVKENNDKDEIKKTFERQKCLESFDNKDATKFNTDRGLSDKLSKMNSEMEFMQSKNKQNFNNFKLLNKIKLPKIVEESNDYHIKKKFTEDLNEEQLANFYYTSEQVERINNNIISVRKTKNMKKEEMRNLLVNNRIDNSIAAAPATNTNYYMSGAINSHFINNNNFPNANANGNSAPKSPKLFKRNSITNLKSFKSILPKTSKKKVSESVNKKEFINLKKNYDDI